MGQNLRLVPENPGLVCVRSDRRTGQRYNGKDETSEYRKPYVRLRKREYKMTKHWIVKSEYNPDEPSVKEAAMLLRQGEQVAFPTETVYGLGADARNTKAVEGIFTAKGRPSDNPLIVHIAEFSQLSELAASVDDVSLRLARAFWPGPLTLVLPVRPGVLSPLVTAGLATVGLRMPDHPVALSLIAAAGCPIAAPSANRSGRPSPTLAAHVREDLGGRIAGVLDGGATGVGLESTVVEVAPDGRVHVLRPGGITPEELERAGGRPVVWDRGPARVSGEAVRFEGSDDDDFRPKAPGMKYTHYAPKGLLTVVKGTSAEAVRARIQQETDRARQAGERTGVLAPAEHAPLYRADLVVSCGSMRDPSLAAHELFASLRKFDEAGVTCIFAEAYEETGIGIAVMNRLLKAAGHRMLMV